MLEASEQPEKRPRDRRWPRRIAIGAEAAAFLALILLYQQVLDYRRSMGCGEQCAWKAMGLMLILFVGACVIAPGVVAASYFGRQAYLRWRQDDGPMATVILHTVPLVMSAVVVGMLLLPPRAVTVAPKTVAPPSNAEELAGYVWATDSGIVAERDCIKGSASFIEGCKRYARQHSAAP